MRSEHSKTGPWLRFDGQCCSEFLRLEPLALVCVIVKIFRDVAADRTKNDYLRNYVNLAFIEFASVLN